YHPDGHRLDLAPARSLKYLLDGRHDILTLPVERRRDLHHVVRFLVAHRSSSSAPGPTMTSSSSSVSPLSGTSTFRTRRRRRRGTRCSRRRSSISVTLVALLEQLIDALQGALEHRSRLLAAARPRHIEPAAVVDAGDH